MKKTIAAFDIDGTILPRNSAERIFIKYLVNKGELRIADAVRYMMQLLMRLPRGWTDATKGNKSYLKGKSANRIDSLAEECFHEEIAPRISDRAREKIEEHRSRGEKIVLLSGTLDVLLERFTAHLGAEHSHGSTLVISDGRYSGGIDGIYPYGSAKAEIVQSNYSPDLYDLSASFAYANHLSDLEFLGLFGHPALANPNPLLAAEAKKRGIEIIHF
ncbi:MAG: HAD-IB family hydrolase [Candidatus Krumholzibacteria bacterium]|nr:HAD-IB family hydrolase [Candidatus Krumholzibacteria bacterium]